METQTTLRDQLESSFAEAEQVAPEVSTPAPDRPRDEAGRFAPKAKEEAAPVEAVAPPQAAPQQWTGPSTWKKEYRPLYDKLAAGQPLTPDEAKKIAEYTNQRENDFKTGVSTYKSEAQAAKDLQEAITPFLPELQARGVAPAAWVKQLGSAHYALTKGTPELKLQVFRELARQYGVPLQAVLQQPDQVPPIVHDLLGQIAQLKQEVNGVTSWRQQQETTSLTSEVQKYANDTQNYPHFEAVRGTMAQLLETGLAQDIPSAYQKAIWMQDDVREAEQLRLSQAGQQQNAVRKAKASAVSPKSSTPTGSVTTAKPTDRRAAIEAAFDELGGDRV